VLFSKKKNEDEVMNLIQVDDPALSHCRIECVTAFGTVMHHAAATASRHVFIAVA
jgi:hypothetical protein